MPTLLGNNSEINGNPRALPKSFINTNITILYYNARSLYPKLDQLKVECLVHNPHVVCITETWLDSTIMDSELYIPDFDIVRLDRNRHGGGVIIYFRSTFICNLLFMLILNALLFGGWIFVTFMFVCCTDCLVNNRCSTHCFPLCVPLTVMYFQTFIWLVILILMYQTTIILYFPNFFVSPLVFYFIKL